MSKSKLRQVFSDMNNLFTALFKKVSKKNVNFKQEALRKNCLEQFEKLLSKGLSLPIKLL